MKIFETERLNIRRLTNEDEDYLFLLNGNEDVVRYIRPVGTKEESNKRLQEIIEKYSVSPNQSGWAVTLKSNDEFIGLMAVFPIENSNDIQLGYSLIPQYWGNGYATEIAECGIKHAFETIGLEILFANCECANTASLNVIHKSGFVVEKNFWEEEKEVIRFQLTKEKYFNSLR